MPMTILRMRRGLLGLAALSLAAGRGVTAVAACASAVVRPYAGPLFDAMAQIESSQSADFVLDAMRAFNVGHMALFARLHRRRSGEHNVLQAGARAPDRIVMGAPKAFDERDDLTDGFVRRTLSEISTRRYAFVGELMFTHGDKIHGEQTAEGERYVDPLSPGVLRLMDGLEGRSIAVMTHWEVYDWKRDWARVSELYRRYPRQTFIWPHAGFGDVEQVVEVLDRHAHVVATLSKKEHDQRQLSDNAKAARLGAGLVDACNELKSEWKALIVQYQDRLMFATDAHKDFRWRRYGDVVTTWRGILAQLPPDVAEKIAYRNALRVYAFK
jgi:Amidohydrolase